MAGNLTMYNIWLLNMAGGTEKIIMEICGKQMLSAQNICCAYRRRLMIMFTLPGNFMAFSGIILHSMSRMINEVQNRC
jgi:hypothetical protein